MKNLTTKISLLMVCILLSNSLTLNIQQVSAINNKSSYSTDYSGNFSLETLYKHNQTIHSWFNFKVSVKDNNVTIAPDGSFSKRGYVWGDDYEFKIYDHSGRIKLDTKVYWFGNVYNDATTLTNKFASASIVVGDTIEITRIYYKNTVRWDIPEEFLYNNATQRSYNYPGSKVNKYYFSERGFIPQTNENNVVPYAAERIKHKIELPVRNVKTGAVEYRPIYLTFKDAPKQKSLDVDVSSFGEVKDYVWDDSIEFYGYGYPDGYVKYGIKVLKGAAVEKTVQELSEFIDFDIGIKDYLKISSTNGKVKLSDETVYNGKNLLTIFSNTNNKFDTGISTVNFYIAPTGLIQIKR